LNKYLNEIEVIDNSIYIKDDFITKRHIIELYILLEHVLTEKFSSIYREKIENNLLSKDEYKEHLKSIILSRGIYFVFFVDSNDIVVYYINVQSNIEEVLNEIVNLIY